MITRQHANSVTTLILDRPEKRNSLNWRMIGDLAVGVAEADADPDCRCLVIKGRGKHFAAGRDLGEADAAGSLEETLHNDELYTSLFETLRRMAKPSLAVVRGYAVAGGFTLAMGCDFVIADRTARFGALEMRVGFPAAVNTAVLGHLVGPRQALELLLSAELFDAEHLYRIGLINRLADSPADLEAIELELVSGFVGLDPMAVKLTKETHRAMAGMPISEALVMAKQLNALMMASGRIDAAAAKFAEHKAKPTPK